MEESLSRLGKWRQRGFEEGDEIKGGIKKRLSSRGVDKTSDDIQVLNRVNHQEVLENELLTYSFG